MTAPNSVSQNSILLSVVLAAAIALPVTLFSYLVTGATLGLFFAGLVLVTILLPPLALLERDLFPQAIIASIVNDSVGIVWLIAVFTSDTTLLQWFKCYLLLASYSFALLGLSRALSAVRFNEILASAITIAIGMLWLSWPIWLARFIVIGSNDAIVAWLAPPHPVLVLNAVLKNLGIWSEQAIAYNHLLNLGQDVAYQLPDGIVSGIFVHLIVGGIFFTLASIGGTRRRRRHLPGQ